MNSISQKYMTRKLRFHSSGSLFCVFALVLAGSFSTTFSSAVDDLLAILVHLQLDDANLGWVNTDINGSTIGLLSLDTFDVDTELFTVALDYFANFLDFIVLTNRHRPDSILLSKVLG